MEFFHETTHFLEEVERKERGDGHGLQIEAVVERRGGTPAPAGKSGSKPLAPAGFATDQRKARKQYDNFMDFSSEIEFDERFDAGEYMADTRVVGRLTEGQPRIDRSLPAEARPNTKVQRKKNREKLFEAYKQSLEEHEMAQRKVTFDPTVDAEEELKDPAGAARERERERQLREKIEDEKYTVNIEDFINEHYLYLPANRQGNAYQLLRALQSKPYGEVEKHSGLTRKNMAFMNEERRKRLGLPPLTPIDYNCLERAAQKLRLVVDCLMLSRRMSGFTVVPKDAVVTQMFKQQEQRHDWHKSNAIRPNKLSRALFREWGQHIELERAFNPDSAQVQRSVQKIKAYQQSNHMMPQFEDGPAEDITHLIQQQLLLEDPREDGGFQARAAALDDEPVRSVVFDQDMAELERRYGSGTVPPPGRSCYEYDAFAARHRRIVNEFESYIEDRSIVDQQALRLPEEETGSSAILISTIQVRKIKSNVDNILQLLWKREAEQQRAAQMSNKIFTGDRDLDNLESDDDAGAGREQTAPEFMASAPKTTARLGNEALRRGLLEKAPKIVRLQSKGCTILSDHEDVLAYDAAEYPPGTDKVSKFMVLDVA